MRFICSLPERPLTVQPARVSAVPLNRVWPGHQRPASETELASFVTFDMDQPTTLTVRVEDAEVRSVEIRPIEFGIPFTVEGNTVTVTLDRPRKFTLEVNGFHEALHVFANEPDTFTPDEHTRYFGPGEHHPGMILLESGETLYLAEGAVVYARVYAVNAKNVRICGRGVLDGSELFRGYEEAFRASEDCEKLLSLGLSLRGLERHSGGFVLYGCEDVIVEGIILRDPPFWCGMTRNQCRRVVIRNIKMVGLWRYNADGFDICSSHDVLLEDCFIRSYDDCVVVRGSLLDGEFGGCSNIVVRNNVLWCDWGKNLEVWSGSRDSYIRRVSFEDNYLIRVCHTAISVDTWYGSEDIRVEDVAYENIHIDTHGEPLLPVYQTREDQVYDPAEGDPTTHSVWIQVGRIGRATGEQGIAHDIDVSGFKIRYENIRFGNVTVSDPDRIRATVDPRYLTACSGITFEDCRL